MAIIYKNNTTWSWRCPVCLSEAHMHESEAAAKSAYLWHCDVRNHYVPAEVL